MAAVGGATGSPHSHWLEGWSHSETIQTSCASVNQSGVAIVFGEPLHLKLPLSLQRVRKNPPIGVRARIYASTSPTTDASFNLRSLLEFGEPPVEKRNDGFGVSGVFGDEHRCLVRLRGATQRLLERLEPKVSADLSFNDVYVCVHSSKC